MVVIDNHSTYGIENEPVQDNEENSVVVDPRTLNFSPYELEFS